MIDIVGPANSLNAVTTRPSDGRGFGSVDSFFRDCTTPASQDGTQVTAAWLNQVTGMFRNMIRANGLKRDGVNPVVPYDQSDDMLVHAFQQMIQRCQLNSGADGGSVNAIVAQVPVTPAEMVPGIEIAVIAAFTPTGPATLSVPGFAALPIRRAGNLALTGGEWLAGDWVKFKLTGNASTWQLMGNAASDILNVVQSQFLITGSVTKTVGGGGTPDFTTIALATNWLSKYLIAPTGTVRFLLAGTVLNQAVYLPINHPNMSQVTFEGAALLASPPSAAAFVVTGDRVADATNALTALRAIYPTEIRFTGTGGNGLISSTGPTLKNILVTGDGTGLANTGGLLLSGGATLSNVAVHGFVAGGIALLGGILNVSGVVSSTSCGAAGLTIQNGAGVQQNANIFTSFNVSHGIQLISGGNFSSPSGNGTTQSTENGAYGAYCAYGSVMQNSPGSGFKNNGSGGAILLGGGSFIAPSASLINNGGWGYTATGGFSDLTSATVTGNATNAVIGQSGAIISATGTTGVATHCSPAINTVGNNGALIIN